jgi:hypothetical protein
MNKLNISLIVSFVVASGAVALTTLHDRPARAETTAQIDASEIMVSAKDLPVAHYDDYCVVFCPTE